MNAEKSDARALTAGVDPTWSPDGARLAVTRVRCVADICGSDLFVVNADGSGLRQLVQGSPFDTADAPAWSPNGALIAFTRRCCFLGGSERAIHRRAGQDQFTGPGCCTGARASETGLGSLRVSDRLRGGARQSQHRGHDHSAAGGKPNLLAGSPETERRPRGGSDPARPVVARRDLDRVRERTMTHRGIVLLLLASTAALRLRRRSGTTDTERRHRGHHGHRRRAARSRRIHDRPRPGTGRPGRELCVRPVRCSSRRAPLGARRRRAALPSVRAKPPSRHG